jgi:hypothetical protein
MLTSERFFIVTSRLLQLLFSKTENRPENKLSKRFSESGYGELFRILMREVFRAAFADFILDDAIDFVLQNST